MMLRKIDKSALAIGTPVRVRSRAHLDFIRSLPCLVCRGPAIAHHLTHAQPKARGLKAGDQWTVPLCEAPHHRSLHARGDEAGWWAARGINAIEAAAEYWAISPARK